MAGATGPHAHDVLRAARQSFVDGRQQGMWAGAVVMGVLFMHAALRGPKNTPSAVADEAQAAEALATVLPPK
ncbi:hypothetical protein SALBM135S_08578 [Streptomyces alboniger]